MLRQECGLQGVLRHALLSQLLVGGVGASVVGVGVDADASTGDEEPKHLDVARIHEVDEVVEDGVDAVFVEVAMVAEREEVEFQAFAFYHATVGDVHDAYFGEVGLTRDGAEGCEFGAVEFDPVVAFGMLVFEGFEDGGVVGGGDGCAVSQLLQVVLLAVHVVVFVLFVGLCFGLVAEGVDFFACANPFYYADGDGQDDDFVERFE